jgi:site-specific DNA recombinase
VADTPRMLITQDTFSNSTAVNQQPVIRCAIYARYSSDLQRPTSIDDQIRNCRAAANEKGWIVLDEFIRSDSELTGRTLVGREGVADLVRFAKQRTPPFDCVLIDDTSRLGRYLPDVLRECDEFTHLGVFIYFASDRLDSRDESFRIVHLVKGYGDERYVIELGKRIHRGQAGCILKGYTPGGRTYGYTNENITDESRKGDHGRPFVIGVVQKIVADEAKVVARIFDMRAAGTSFGRIARTLNAEGVLSPRHPNKAGVRAWFASGIKQICRNELYRGVRVWNRTQQVFNHAEGKKSKRKRPQSEWITQEVSHLRIVSNEIWEKVQEVNRCRGKGYAQRVGGLNRSEASRTYLFSGVLYCGVCGDPYTVICGKAPNVRYGCPNYRFRDTCTNSVTILRTRLEQQLVSALSRNLLHPELEEDRVREFSVQLKAAVENRARLASEAATNGSRLKEERSDLERQADNLVKAIAKHGISSLLSAELAAVESRLAEIKHRLTAKPAPNARAFSEEQIREFLRQASQQFSEALTSDPQRGKQEIQKRITKLVLTPKETPEGRRLEVTGDVALFVENDVMVNNSMEEITQHYTLSRIVLANILLDPSLPVAA